MKKALYRKRICAEKEKLTPEKVFHTPQYRDLLTSIGHEITGGKLTTLRLYDDKNSGIAGWNQGETVAVNLGNQITSSFLTLELKSDSLIGILGHECGHYRYTDSALRKRYAEHMLNGSWYPKEPVPENAQEKEALDAMNVYFERKDKAILSIFLQTASYLSNLLNDMYIEEKMCALFPGSIRRGILMNRDRNVEWLPTLREMLETEKDRLSILMNLCAQYWMEWKIYEEWLDITLYRQMTNLIYKLSSNEEKYKIYMQLKENDMFLEKPKVDMETAYGLHYPGEVLERIREHLTLTKQTYRALGLALARMMPLQETCMFNGTQKDLFWKKMKQILGEKDLFLISINYICEEKEKNRWKQAMHAYPFERAEEMLFAMSILPDDETLWEGIKQRLADSFSKNRKISVFTEWNLFVWMVGKVMTKLKGYRKKDLDILKLLVKLTGTNAKNADAVLEKRMRMFGYSDKETAFLNFVLMYFVERPDRISLSGLTAEKIGLNVLEAFLPGKETYPEEAYVLCSRILRTYGKLSVRIDGKERLEKCMNETFRVENVKTFLTLFPFRSNEPEEWHYIDLTEEKWDPLVKELSSEEFEACVTDTLKGKTYSTKSLLKYLERYENLTGKRYQDVFWKKSEPELYAVFNRLILHGILDGKKYLEEFVKDYKNEDPDLEKKWEFMAGYLKSEIKGLCNEHSYPMLKFLINEIGMDGCEFLSPWRILKETFSLGYYAIQHRECEFFSPVLGKEEHRELFSMVEKKFFYEYPDIYPEYLTALLLKESTALWMEQSEAYELSKLLLPFISDSYRRETLYQKYMTEEDRKRYQERKEWLKEQKKRMERWKTEKNIKQQFNQMLRENRKTDKELQSIYEFYKNGRYSYGYKKLYCKIVSSYLKDDFAGTAKKPMAKEEALYLLKLAENMYQDECMELTEINGLIERAEVA